jgi:hypothetical protein
MKGRRDTNYKQRDTDGSRVRSNKTTHGLKVRAGDWISPCDGYPETGARWLFN